MDFSYSGMGMDDFVVAGLRPAPVFTLQINTQPDPDAYQDQVDDNKIEVIQCNNARTDQDRQRRKSVSETHEQSIYGWFRLVKHFLGRGQPQHMPGRVLDGVVAGVFRNFHDLYEAENRRERHRRVGNERHERRGEEQHAHAAKPQNSRYEK